MLMMYAELYGNVKNCRIKSLQGNKWAEWATDGLRDFSSVETT